MILSVASLVLRFRRSRGEERQQMKWFVYAGVLVVAVLLVPVAASPLLQIFVMPALPVAAGVAILRYRLYDIDAIINRTLVYGSLTVTLAALYLGSVVLLRGLVFGFTGRSSQLVVVASTLAVAALFGPLRRRIQSAIDRRFYRSKYDAAKTLSAFGARLRDETDLDSLGDDLVGVVRETVRPEHASLWLRSSGRDRKEER